MKSTVFQYQSGKEDFFKTSFSSREGNNILLLSPRISLFVVEISTVFEIERRQKDHPLKAFRLCSVYFNLEDRTLCAGLAYDPDDVRKSSTIQFDRKLPYTWHNFFVLKNIAEVEKNEG